MKTVHLNEKLHKTLKIKAAKEGKNLDFLVNTMLWKALEGVRYEADNH